jgi:flagellar basal body-associated protein FliL
MNTIILVLVVLAAAAGVTYFLMKKGKIEDANGNNIPDVIEKPIEEVKEVVKQTAAKVKKVAAVAEKVVKEVKVKTPTAKKPAKKTTK